jgi:hypothetical protein
MSQDLEPAPKIGRPRKEVSTADHALVEDLAADGWSLVGIAWKLGMGRDALRRRMNEDPALEEAFEVGRERERQALHNRLFRIAMEGSGKEAISAAAILLNSRHGYRNEPLDGAGRASVIINMPDSKPLADFIEVKNADGTQVLQLSAART